MSLGEQVALNGQMAAGLSPDFKCPCPCKPLHFAILVNDQELTTLIEIHTSA